MATDGTAKRAFVIDSQPAKLNLSSVIKIASSLQSSSENLVFLF
jgi:hypothetical protein